MNIMNKRTYQTQLINLIKIENKAKLKQIRENNRHFKNDNSKNND